MARKKIVILNKMNTGTIRAAAVLFVLSIILLQVIFWAFNLGSANLGAAFMLMLLGAVVVIPYWILDAPPHFKTKEVLVLLGVIVFDIFFLMVIAPRVLPDMFPAAISVKNSVYSILAP